MGRYKGFSGVRDERGIWFSPLPVAHEFDLLGATIPHHKTDVVLAVSAGEAFGFKEFHKIVKELVCVCTVVITLALVYGVIFVSTPDSIESALILIPFILIGLVPYVAFSPFLLYYFFKARNDFPVFFHRQRREVLFLRSTDFFKKPEYFITSWESVQAVTSNFFSFNQFWARRYSHLSIGVDEPEYPGAWWARIKILGFNADHSRLNWCQICRYMDAHPDHFYPGSPELEEAYDSAAKFLPRFPDYVYEWLKPIPEEQWTRPTVKLRWYNGYLLALYKSGIGWSGLGRIEESIGYPGDEEAAKQLEQGWLVPLPGANGSAYAAMRAGQQPPVPTGPPRDFRGEVIDLTPKKKRTLRQWVQYWTSKEEQ